MGDIILLLGRPDAPTDGVADHAEHLSAALRAEGVASSVVRLPVDAGRNAALDAARSTARAHPGAWFLVQYTALAWSPRALPTLVLHLLRAIREEGGRTAIVFHDVRPYEGSRPQDRVRRFVQAHVMRRAARMADRAIAPLPADRLRWMLDEGSARFATVPIGANLAVDRVASRDPSWSRAAHGMRRIGIFGIIADERRASEIQALREIALRVQARTGAPVRVQAFGRGVPAAEAELRAALEPHGVEVVAEGIVPAPRLEATLQRCDVILFLRSALTGQRGSALAAVAAGVPLVAFAGRDTAPPVTSIGALFAPEGDTSAMADLAAEVVTSEKTWRQLHLQQARAFDASFSWKAVARRLLEVLA